MPFWRTPQPANEPVPAQPGKPEPITGARECSEHECPRTDAAICVYVDRRGRPCDSSWCPDHQVVIASTCYCRRHAGIVRALMTDAGLESKGLPDVDTRAPSLVNWVANGIGDKVERMLAEVVDPSAGERIEDDVVHGVGDPSAQIWARTWKIVDATGTRLRIEVTIEEANDTIPIVRVANRIVFQQVPPWIENRSTGAHPTPLQDFAERRSFYQDIVKAISDALFEPS